MSVRCDLSDNRPASLYEKGENRYLANALQWEQISQKSKSNHTMKSPDFKMKSALTDSIKTHAG